MSAISTLLGKIKTSIYGEDVRDAIHDSIEQCYNDVHNPTLNTEALEAAVQAEIAAGHMAALTIGDGTITAEKLSSNPAAVTTAKIADGAITQAKLDPNIEFVQVDDSLTQEGQAADAAAVGEAISELNGSLDALNGEEITGWTSGSYIVTSGSTVSISSTVAEASWRCLAITVEPGEFYEVSAKGGNSPRAWCIIDANGNVINVSPASTTASAVMLDMPNDAEYLVINDNNSSNAKVVKGLSIDQRVDKLENRMSLFVKTESPTEQAFINRAYSCFNGRDMGVQSARISTSSPIDGSATRVVAKTGYSFMVLAYSTPEKTISNYMGMWNGSAFVRPADAIYFKDITLPTNRDDLYYYVTVRNDSNSAITPSNGHDKVEITYDMAKWGLRTLEEVGDKFTEFEAAGTLDITDLVYKELHVKPESTGALNAIKRARQITDMEWCPVAQLPRLSAVSPESYAESSRQMWTDEFTAQKDYIGLPYGDDTISARIIGTCRPIESFLTAVTNDDSIEYSLAGGSFYHCSCAGLTSYALGIPYVFTANFTSVESMETIFTVSGDANTDPLDAMKLCDILQTSGHCAMISDIVKDSNGDVQYVEVSEMTRYGSFGTSHRGGKYGGKARRVTFSAEEFCTYFRGFKIIRYGNLSGVPYSPCKFSPVLSEKKRIRNPYLPIMPYEGNKALYAGGSSVKLIIADTSYTHVIVTKNGNTWGSPIAITGADVTIACDNDSAKYTAYLVTYSGNSIQYKSGVCEWYVYAPVSITVTSSNGTTSFVVVVDNGEFKPWFANVKSNMTYTGLSHIVRDSYTESESSGTHTYTFTATYSTTPTNYVVGLWSDNYGSIEVTGNIV